MKKLLFAINPHAGKGEIKTKALEVIDLFVHDGYEVTVHTTQRRREITHLLAGRAALYDLIVCCGGDGTLNETIDGLMRCAQRPPLGYIPAGSTNDFANSLKIPKDIVKAAHVAVEGRKFPVDVGYFNGDSFIYIAAFGLFTDVSYQTSQELKNVLGHAAYILEGAKRLHNITSYKMRVEYDGNIIEDEFAYGMITNSVSVGGFKKLTGKNVLLDDGLFEVTLIRMPKNPVEWNEILSCLANLKDDSDLIYTFKTDCVKFLPEDVIPWTLDGEFGGEHKNVIVKNVHQALEIMVKNKA